MRDYSKVGPQFWIGRTGKKLRAAGYEAQIVGMYLMTSPHANMLGLYYVSMESIAHETGLGMEGASKGLLSCIEADFCSYCTESEVVWVHEMAFYQIAESLTAADKRSLGVQNEYNSLPANPHLARFFEKYSVPFNMTKMRGNIEETASPLQAPLKPRTGTGARTGTRTGANPIVEQTQLDHANTIFSYWQKMMDSPKSVMDDKRKALIVKALKSYSPADICKAIRGCSKTPHNMGQNDRNTKFNGLNLILRDAEHIDYFINLDSGDAKPGKETVEQMNERVMAEFLGDAQNDENTIEMEV